MRTASSEQVRRPINRDGLDQWQAFEPWLGPLKAALGPVLDRLSRRARRVTIRAQRAANRYAPCYTIE